MLKIGFDHYNTSKVLSMPCTRQGKGNKYQLAYSPRVITNPARYIMLIEFDSYKTD
jgi:hypothetical protein